MTNHASGTFKVRSWDEGPYAEHDRAPKLTHAEVVVDYRGDLAGEGNSGSLMFYPSESTATFSGFERVVGALGGRRGSFVLQGSGTYENGTATMRWTVVPESGTEQLRGLSGSGGYVAHHGAAEVAYELDYDLP